LVLGTPEPAQDIAAPRPIHQAEAKLIYAVTINALERNVRTDRAQIVAFS
jgi:hypothetical protein